MDLQQAPPPPPAYKPHLLTIQMGDNKDMISNFCLIKHQVPIGVGAQAVVQRAFKIGLDGQPVTRKVNEINGERLEFQKEEVVEYAVKVIELNNAQDKQAFQKEWFAIQRISEWSNQSSKTKDQESSSKHKVSEVAVLGKQFIVETDAHELNSQNRAYVFMEFCKGGTLHEYRWWRGKDILREDEVISLFSQTGLGLLFQHSLGIIHQDIKPSNILIKDNFLKYCDFGSAFVQGTREQSDQRVGTISYMPYEKLTSPVFRPSFRTDAFSLGTTLFEVIFARKPYCNADKPSPEVYVSELESNATPKLEELLNQFPVRSQKLQKVLQMLIKMVAKKDTSRPSFQDFEKFFKDNAFLLKVQPYSLAEYNAFRAKSQRDSSSFVDEICFKNIEEQSILRVDTCNGIPYEVSPKRSLNILEEFPTVKLLFEFVKLVRCCLLSGVRHLSSSRISGFTPCTYREHNGLMQWQFLRLASQQACMNLCRLLLKKYGESLNAFSSKWLQADLTSLRQNFTMLLNQFAYNKRALLQENFHDDEANLFKRLQDVCSSMMPKSVRRNIKKDVLSLLFLSDAEIILEGAIRCQQYLGKGAAEVEKLMQLLPVLSQRMKDCCEREEKDTNELIDEVIKRKIDLIWCVDSDSQGEQAIDTEDKIEI